jgi:hypothetical protein
VWSSRISISTMQVGRLIRAGGGGPSRERRLLYACVCRIKPPSAFLFIFVSSSVTAKNCNPKSGGRQSRQCGIYGAHVGESKAKGRTQGMAGDNILKTNNVHGMTYMVKDTK